MLKPRSNFHAKQNIIPDPAAGAFKKKRKDSSNSKHKNHHATPDHFRRLYPLAPELLYCRDTTLINIAYKGRKLAVKAPLYVETKYLEYLFHQEIFAYECQAQRSKEVALYEAARVIGYESVDNDILLDYRISLGNGILDRQVDFRCLKYHNEGTIEKYKILKCLAIGGFSKVYLVRSLVDGKFYAMKVMSKQFIFQNEKETIIFNEKEICQSIKHPFIVKLNHCFETRNFLCFVFDYCPGGELFFYLKKIKRMTEEQARFYFIEILYGLQYLHQQGIVYRDLKPENLLIDSDGHIKIADFGLSKGNVNADELTYSFCGSAEYMPPEMILKTGHSFGVDYYTLGALLYELVTGLPPFYSRDEEEIKEAILTQELTFPSRVPLSNQIKLLLRGLLTKNQKQRLGSLKGIKEVLFHPWLGRINSQAILNKKLEPPYVPDINQFNFDENELGEDEQEFTAALMSQYRHGKLSRKECQFPDFEYIGDSNLRPEHKTILESPPESSMNASPSSGSKVKTLNPSASVGSLKSRTLHRQASSPYLDNILSAKLAVGIKRSASKDKKSLLKSSSLKSLSTSKKTLHKNSSMSKISFDFKKENNSANNTCHDTSYKKILKPIFTNNFFLKDSPINIFSKAEGKLKHYHH